ncbi:MAG: 3-dehydroquinate synthase [Oligoflexia bacterium]|nr:3-dehydroquinate synthase [Oligoflexia bacterium]
MSVSTSVSAIFINHSDYLPSILNLLNSLEKNNKNNKNNKIAIITDENVLSPYAQPLHDKLVTAGFVAKIFSFASGDNHKTRQTKELIEDQMFAQNFGRDTIVLAVGGGVVTDLAGFIAATFCRGIPYINLPTSLLAMVDASIGGKNGVNIPAGKNLIGTIYQPRGVLIDTKNLKTLPLCELKNGIVEMIKNGLVASAQYFDYLEKNYKKIITLDDHTITQAIHWSCEIKREIVEEDELENGKRRLLNLGHTVGHALEKISNFTLSHGEAVALGILTECHMAVQLKELDAKVLNRILKIFRDYALPLTFPNVPQLDAILDAMILDKKSLQGMARFVVIKEIGTPIAYEGAYCRNIEKNIIKDSLLWIKNDLLSDKSTKY